MDLDGSGHGVVSGKKGVGRATPLGSRLKDCPQGSLSSLPQLLGFLLSRFMGFSHADAALGTRDG